jgi:hypothetical protein
MSRGTLPKWRVNVVEVIILPSSLLVVVVVLLR